MLQNELLSEVRVGDSVYRVGFGVNPNKPIIKITECEIVREGNIDGLFIVKDLNGVEKELNKFNFNTKESSVQKHTYYFYSDLESAENAAKALWEKSKQMFNKNFKKLHKGFEIFSNEFNQNMHYFSLDLNQKIESMKFAEEHCSFDNGNDLYYEISFYSSNHDLSLEIYPTRVHYLNPLPNGNRERTNSPLNHLIQCIIFNDFDEDDFENTEMDVDRTGDIYYYWYSNDNAFGFSHYLYVPHKSIGMASDFEKYILEMISSKYEYIQKEYFRQKEIYSIFNQEFSINNIEYVFSD